MNETHTTWTCIEISGEISEAKNLIYPKSYSIIKSGFDLKTTVKLDFDQSSSYTTAFTREPNSDISWSWKEEFKFEAVPRFKFINFVIWADKVEIRSQNNMQENSLTPIGKIAIPESYLVSSQVQNQWLVLRDASLEARITGQLQLSIEYYSQTGSLSVSLLKGQDIDSNKPLPGPNTFVSFHLFPDPKAISTEISLIKKGTHNPYFSEAFSFKFDSKCVLDEELHCAVWGEEGKSITFLGHCIIPLKGVVEAPIKESWFTLSALLDDSIWNAHLNTKSVVKNETTEDFIKRFVQKIQEKLPDFHEGHKAHMFLEKPMVRGNCFICDGKLTGSHLSCGDCSRSCHQKCQETAGTACGGVGLLKLSTLLTKTEVLDLDNYLDLIRILRENNFKMLFAIAKKLCSIKEKISNLLFPVLRYDYLPFLKLALRNEINETEYPQALFRSYSFCTNVLFYLNRTNYLDKTLKNILLQIVNSKRSFEIDESKFDDAYKEHWGISQCNVINNMENLSNFLEILINSIFDSAASLPCELKDLFYTIRKAASKQFPNAELVGYTSVSGIIFLRIINAALLGPEKFGIRIDRLNSFQFRKLILISKVLQKLANFVQFQNKEACMLPLNSFLLAKTKPMKDFIDSISTIETSEQSTQMIEYIESIEKSPKLIALSCARIHDILLKHSNNLSGVEDYSKLKTCMDYIENTRKSCQPIHESKASKLSIEAPKQRGDSIFNSSDDKADKTYMYSSDSNHQSKKENQERDKLVDPVSPILALERQEEILLNLKDLKSTQESQSQMISNLVQELVEYKAKSQEIQKCQELKLHEFQQQNVSALERLETSKVNFYDFENIRKDLEKALNETTDELQRDNKSDPNNILSLERLESLMQSFDGHKKESLAKLANAEADLLFFKSQVLEMLETNHLRLNDFQDNINLSLEIQERNMKKLERGKVTYEDLESMRNDIKFSIEAALEKKPEDIQKSMHENDIQNLTSYLYQDSFANSSSILKVPVADSSLLQAPVDEIKEIPPPRSNQETNKAHHQISRYTLKPSSRLTEIENRLASLRSDFLHKRKPDVFSSTIGNAAQYPFKSFQKSI